MMGSAGSETRTLRRGDHSMLGLCLPILLAVMTQTPSPIILNGAVRDEAGRPIAGASVFISTAAPRKGVGVL
jgi:hypothetical protein